MLGSKAVFGVLTDALNTKFVLSDDNECDSGWWRFAVFLN